MASVADRPLLSRRGAGAAAAATADRARRARRAPSFISDSIESHHALRPPAHAWCSGSPSGITRSTSASWRALRDVAPACPA